MNKLAKTSVPINELLASRWSCRSFNPDKEISNEQIISLCEAARWAPSCSGEEPWRYLVFNKFENPEAFKTAFDCLDEWNQKWVKNVPVLFISLAYSKFTKNDKPNRWCQHDTGAASENICLQAKSLGLMAHQMGGFFEDKVIETFGIPENYTPMSMIAVGYQDIPDKLEERYKKSEIGERTRTEIGTRFFRESWQNPIKE